MNSQSIQKEMINWNIHTYQHLSSFVDLIHRVENKTTPKQHDFKLRDFYFNPSFHIFAFKNRITFIEHASQIIRNIVSFNQLGYLQSLSFEHHMQKHQFWNRIYKRQISNQQDHSINTQIQTILWTYRLIPLFIFVSGAFAILKITGISRMTRRKQAVGLLLAAFLSDLFVRTRKSSEIFYLIPPISDNKLQAERLQLLNKGLVLDGKINEIEEKPKYVDELIDVADEETDYDEKKKILQAAGFEVIDSKDYQYI